MSGKISVDWSVYSTPVPVQHVSIAGEYILIISTNGSIYYKDFGDWNLLYQGPTNFNRGVMGFDGGIAAFDNQSNCLLGNRNGISNAPFVARSIAFQHVDSFVYVSANNQKYLWNNGAYAGFQHGASGPNFISGTAGMWELWGLDYGGNVWRWDGSTYNLTGTSHTFTTLCVGDSLTPTSFWVPTATNAAGQGFIGDPTGVQWSEVARPNGDTTPLKQMDNTYNSLYAVGTNGVLYTGTFGSW